jgi:hypothetical protein
MVETPRRYREAMSGLEVPPSLLHESFDEMPEAAH